MTPSSPLLNLYTPAQVSEFDRIAIEHHNIPGIVLMKRAGRAAFELMQSHWAEMSEVHVFSGSGNNGGDGYVVAALAARAGLSATVWQLDLPKTASAKQACDYAQQEGAALKEFDVDAWQRAEINPLAVVVDAILGIGFNGELKPRYASAIEAIIQSGLPVLAVDIPSGINGRSGHCDSIAVKATVTLSFIAQKIGNKVGQGLAHSGRVYLDTLAVPDDIVDEAEPAATVLDLHECLLTLPARKIDAHKGDYGHLLVVGGDKGYAGAVTMAVQMAARSGAGLVGAATQAENTSAIIARQPEIMARGIGSGLELKALLDKPTVLVIGPGLGQSAWSEQCLYHALLADKPMVMDADALNLLAKGIVSLPDSGQWVMTPHPGEAARLLGISIEQVQADRIAAAKALQLQYGGCVVLKGAGTIVVTPDQAAFICDAGNPGMASGGMGDVLAGLIGSLIAQKMPLDHATCLGVLLHSHAADIVAEKLGQRAMLATDLIPEIGQLLQTIE